MQGSLSTKNRNPNPLWLADDCRADVIAAGSGKKKREGMKGAAKCRKIGLELVFFYVKRSAWVPVCLCAWSM